MFGLWSSLFMTISSQVSPSFPPHQSSGSPDVFIGCGHTNQASVRKWPMSMFGRIYQALVRKWLMSMFFVQAKQVLLGPCRPKFAYLIGPLLKIFLLNW